jgi:uncharacterized protein with beta-barrel porin domain
MFSGNVAYRRGKSKTSTSAFPGVVGKRIPFPFGRYSFAVMSLVGSAALAPSEAFAVCAPAGGPTVTCSGVTLNQGPEVNTGFGTGLQNGLTINVVAGPPTASVIGTSIGIDVGSNNTINNFGTITTNGNGLIGDVYGINANGTNLTVNNSGTIGRLDIPNNLSDLAGINAQDTGLSVTNNFGATIQGATGIQGVGTGTVVNSGLIVGGGGGDGINFAGNNTSAVTVTNNSTGVINGDANGINANSATVFNHGMISGVGFGSTGINANTLTLTNYADGTVTGDGFGISGSQTPNLTITNLGTISATGLGAFVVLGNVVTIVNSGTISDAPGNTGTGTTAISMSTGSITNNANGVISGDVGIVAFGNTTIFNAGTITGVAGTAIGFSSGGNTLTLAPGSVINGSAHGFGADTFQLGGTGTDTFDATLFATQFSGYSTFNKIGSSTWTLTGTNATAMPWTISAGRLDVNGLIVNSTMTVDAGGTLGGTGTVGTTIINGGTLAPGSAAGSAFGPLTVQGNLSFTAASTYMIQVSPANAGSTNVTGTATFGGATVNAVFLPGSYVNRQYTIVHANGGVSGTFNPTVISNMANIQSTLTYDANDAFLNIKLVFIPPPSGSLNVNQQNVANALINFFNATGSIPAVFAALGPGGLTQASGEVATGTQQTTFDAMNLFMGLLTDPFIAGRGDPVTPSSGAPGFAEEDSASAYAAKDKPRSNSERDAYAAIYRKAPPMVDSWTQRWSVWAAGYGGSQTTDGNTVLGSNTVTSRIAGTAVGADYRFSPYTLAGFALAGGGTNFSIANALGTGRSDLFQAGAFIRHTVGPAYVSAALAYGWQDITTDRTVTIAGVDQLRARFNANAFSGRAEAGYRFATPWMGITPYAAAQFTTFDLPAYAERAIAGANTFALSYAAKDVTASRSELGIRTDKSWAMPNSIFTLRGRFAWAHDFNTDRNIAATFQTLPGASFVVNGAMPAHDAALTTASAELKWLNGWSAAATFEGEFSNVTRSYAGKGVVRYAW